MTGAPAVPPPSDLREVGEAEIGGCFALMRQLRPHLQSEAAFVERWRRQVGQGYRLLALWDGDGPAALAGYRLLENLMNGRFLYVDDLVSDAGARRRGHGARLLAHLEDEARALGCSRLVLDTGLDNVLAHRFYYRQGMLARALRFYKPLD